ncbi:hypothetical protein VSVS12_02575 [Vibrio scophthalmi]|nr:hypothetical protein VSVS12_02575 [Vibrio scophthalmi]
MMSHQDQKAVRVFAWLSNTNQPMGVNSQQQNQKKQLTLLFLCLSITIHQY